MQTLMQAVDYQFTRYDLEKMSNRQRKDLHMTARMANMMKLVRQQKEQQVHLKSA